MSRSRVAWITTWVPDRHGGGGQIRQAYLLRALAQTSDVILITNKPVRDRWVSEAIASERLVGAATVDWGRRSKWLRRARDLGVVVRGREPREVANFRSFRRVAATMVREADADAVVVEYAGLAPLIHHRTDKLQPWVLTLHNVGSVMERQEAALYPPGRQAWLHQRDARIWDRWEQQVPLLFDRLITVSQDDAVKFADCQGRAPKVIPNGVDTDRFEFTAPPSGDKLVFTGALNTGPNFDGLLWFCHEVLPRVRSLCASVTFDIVGSEAPPEIVNLAQLPGVTLHVDVPDVLPYIREARIALVPLRIGTGTRLKALEAMASGRPVVGTSVGLGGLGIVPGVHAEVADDPASFAAAITKLLADDEKVQSLTRQARSLVEQHYAWSVIGSEFAEVIRDTIDTRHESNS